MFSKAKICSLCRKMNTVYKSLNGIKTKLLVWEDPFNEIRKDVVICVTGNPGVPDFYSEFGQVLHDLTKLPICVVGQAGQDEVTNHKVSLNWDNQKDLFNLKGQIAHKLDLISHLDKKTNFHLVGHSIGAWEIIEILSKSPQLTNRILSINLLFPTIQKMAESPNGKSLNNIVRRIPNLILLVLKILQILPSFITAFLIYIVLLWNSYPSYYFERIKRVLSPSVMEKVLFLAFDEMDTVKDLNRDSIEKVKHLTNVIYSDRDQWAPVEYMDDLKIYSPEMYLEETQVDHAFVLKSSEVIAEKVANLIKCKKSVQS